MALLGGLCLNQFEKGLLAVDEDRLQGLINTKTITDVYIVEQAPFAR